MTDKVQKIREEVERLQDACMDEEGNIMTAQKQGAYDVLCKLDAFIDSLQEESVNYNKLNTMLNDALSKETKKSWNEWLGEGPASKDKFTFTSLPRLLDRIKPTDRAKWYSSRLADALEEEGYITDAKIVRESIKIMNGEKVPMATMDEEPVNEDLGEYISKLSKQFPEVSFAKLSRIAVRAAKWQLWQINEVLLSEVLPCFMHGGEADEVVAKLEEVLNQKK